MTGISLQWFKSLLNNERVLEALYSSFWLALTAASVSTILGIMASFVIVRRKILGRGAFTLLLVSPLLVPEVVTAVGLLLFAFLVGIKMNVFILLTGHVLLTLPYVSLLAQSRIVGLKREHEEAAASLGAPPIDIFKRITLPLLVPTIVSAFALAAIVSFDNITATLFWKPAGFETLPTQIYSMMRNSISPELNAVAAVIVLITTAVPSAVILIARRSR
ncbi:ABC transporter permease [Agrobacterium rosae]|uniref:ABC transporter permease n=1 Tax=Agrobacterium rosae TaxID=1972867 RepID=UPI0020334D49|nr:ABC transporter permease [Agrobacterium rosae]